MQVVIKLEESKKLEDLWTVPSLRRSLQRYVTIFTNAHRYEFNARSSNFITSSKRFYNHNVSRQERNVMGNSTATDTLVTNTSILQQRNKVSDVTPMCILQK